MKRQGMGRRRLRSDIEYDAVYARRLYCYLANRPHLVKWAKRQVNRRERHEARARLWKEMTDG